MVATVVGSYFLRQLLLRQSPFQYNHPDGPHSNFDGKPARRRHENFTSLFSRSCWGEQQSKVPCQQHSALLSKTQQCHCWPFCCGAGMVFLLVDLMFMLSGSGAGGGCNNILADDTFIVYRTRYTHVTDLGREVDGLQNGNYRTG